MQEEVESKTVNLAVSTTKLTARALIRGSRWFIMQRNQKKLRKQNAHQNDPIGEQSVKKLLKGGAGTDKIELPDGSAKDFCRMEVGSLIGLWLQSSVIGITLWFLSKIIFVIHRFVRCFTSLFF